MAAAKAAEKKAKLAELESLDAGAFAEEREEEPKEPEEEDDEEEADDDGDEPLIPKRPAAAKKAKKRPSASNRALKRPASALKRPSAATEEAEEDDGSGKRDQTKQRKFNELEDSLPQNIKDLFNNAGKHPLGKRARQTQLVNQLFSRKDGRLVLQTDSPFFHKDSLEPKG